MQKENKIFVFDQTTFHANTYKFYVMLLLLPFYDIFYNIILALCRPKKTKKKYSVSICGIFKDEACNMLEWIEFHRIVGVEHFYLYNNFSTDNFQSVLQSYIDQGIVTLIEWPIPQGQFLAYEDFYKKYRHETQWVSFLDLDEFICPYYKTSIADWIRRFERFPCVVLYWKMFGTSGLIERDPKKLITEQFTVSWAKFDSIGKVILNTDYEIANFNSGVHHSTNTKVYFLGRNIVIPPINEFRYFLKWNIHRTGLKKMEDFTIQINHYWSKSLNDSLKKINKGSMCPNYTHTMKQFWWHEQYNKDTDHNIFRFLAELKNTLRLKDQNNTTNGPESIA